MSDAHSANLLVEEPAQGLWLGLDTGGTATGDRLQVMSARCSVEKGGASDKGMSLQRHIG
jgi:hypothetical protein